MFSTSGTMTATVLDPSLAPATLRQFDRLDARARRGDLRGIEDWLVYQVLYRTDIGGMALAQS